jgi:lysophospholipase L1-like esterase
VADGDRACRQGILAFGDSITHGGGALQRNVAQESWALWVARALGLPYTGYAVDGARLSEVVAEQLPAARERAARPDARYDLGLLYAGVNDVRRADWDVDAFAGLYGRALDAIAERCDRMLVLTLPLDLGRPRAVEAIEAANGAITALAAARGALVADLRDFAGPDFVLPDHIHPTSFGQLEIARRALAVLRADGWRVLVEPAALIDPAPATPVTTLGGRIGYAARTVQVSARAVAIRALRRRAGA